MVDRKDKQKEYKEKEGKNIDLEICLVDIRKIKGMI